MPNNLPNANPLSYLGVRPETPPNLIRAQRAPTSGDAEPVGTFWIDEVAGNIWSVSRYVSGSPDWELIGGNNGYPVTPYVVGPAGQADYQTIQAAVNAANTAGGGTVYVQPGAYTESLTLYDKVQIVGSINNNTTITGVHTPPASGNIQIQNCTLASATHIFSSAAAGTTTITIQNCLINCTNGYLFSLLNWTGSLNVFDSSSFGTNDGFVNNTGTASITCVNSTVGAGVGNSYTISGIFTCKRSTIVNPGTIQGAVSSIIKEGCSILGTLTTAATANLIISNSLISTGATACISHGSAGTLLISNSSITSSNNPSIDGAGAGVLTLANVVFTSDAHTAGTLTLGTGSTLKVGGGIESSTTITAGTVLRAAGDVAGAATTVSVSNVVDEALGAGAGTVLMKTANPGNSSGWLKIYNGVDVRYVPYWTNISP